MSDAVQEPTVNDAFEYVINSLSDIFKVHFPDDIQETFNHIRSIVESTAAAPVGDNTTHRYAALDAAIRIMPDTKDTDLIIKRAMDIENYLSGNADNEDDKPLTNPNEPGIL